MLKIFKSEDFGEIRTIDENGNGKEWFCEIDVAKVLRYIVQMEGRNAHPS